MQKIINKEEVVRCQGTSFGVAPTTSGYTFAYSYDGENWTNWDEPTPANEPLTVNGVVPGLLVKLVGNQDDVKALL